MVAQRLRVFCYVCGSIMLVTVAAPSAARSAEFLLKNGLLVSGDASKISSIGENPLAPKAGAGEVDVAPIVVVDNELTRTFFNTWMVASPPDRAAPPVEKIRIRQRVATSGKQINIVGPILSITPFDKWGRRTFSMMSGGGPIQVMQGITEITPISTRVQGLQLPGQSYVWDMRIATSSIPRQTLSEILRTGLDQGDADARLSVVRLLLQSERYRDALEELQDAIKQFPELADLKKQILQLRQLSSQQWLREIRLRRDAGQHALVVRWLQDFPTDDIAEEARLELRELLSEYERKAQDGERVRQLLKTNIEQLEAGQQRDRVAQACEDILTGLNFNTLGRFADFLRLSDDPNMIPEQKLSLAISGSLLGAGEATDNMAVTLSLYDVRRLVREYLNLATDQSLERQQILDQIKSLEGGTPAMVAKLLSNMAPQWPMDGIAVAPAKISVTREQAPPANDGEQQAAADTPEPQDTQLSPEGYFHVQVPVKEGSRPVGYFVQLPPNYDPGRRYPTVITLHGLGTTPHLMVDWWAGAYSDRMRMRLGQATRHGYIVIAPEWADSSQKRYQFSVEEHRQVLFTVRDACKRLAIDTDRIFLSGHDMGGDAAWDLAVSHPDSWAGVIPIVAVSQYLTNDAPMYIARCWENVRALPMYFVAGQMDGDKMSRNARELDRYLTKSGFDVVVVEYRGRGHEHFQEEIQHIFQWMKSQRRILFPREFAAASMRTWNNYFWWVSLAKFPDASLVPPTGWPAARGAKPVETTGAVRPNNSLSISTGVGEIAIWLHPDLVNFDRPITITINGRDHREGWQPDLAVMLEDVRLRGDRLNPFWARFQTQTGRGGR